MLNSILSAINFIDWFSFFKISVTAQGVTMPLSEWCAQYACVQTNYVITLGGILGIIVMLIKKNKKWWWYTFFAIVAVTSITSVGMHTANYGEFQSGVLTTKLIGSFIDMSFTIFIAWSGACCFIFEFCEKKNKRIFATVLTVWTLLVLFVLTLEVFAFKDRPLFIFGGGNAMDGASGGFSMAEFCCFLVALPLIPIVIFNAKSIDRTELRYIFLTVGIFIVALAISNVFGDNEINSLFLGNIHTHSIYHILNGMGSFSVIFWIDYRTQKQLAENKDSEELNNIISESVRTKMFKLNDDFAEKLSEKEINIVLSKGKRDVKSWALLMGIIYSYVLLTLILSIVAAVKGATGAYAQFSYNPYQFLITCVILFAGLNIIGFVAGLKFIKIYKNNKNNISLYNDYISNLKETKTKNAAA